MIEGVTLHGGLRCQVRLQHEPGPVRFWHGGKLVPAQLAYVVGTKRCTILGNEGAQIAVVEHLLAALHIRGWWRDIVIETSAPELPILDGSAQGWLGAIDALGAPPPVPAPIEVEQAYHWEEGGSSVTIKPGAREVCSQIDFAHPAIGEQRWCGREKDFADLASARTFGFLQEVEALQAQGLIQGASLDNAVVFDELEAITPLRFADEPARHKALDALGDFFLLTRPLKGKLHTVKGSHQIHIHVMQKMLACGLVNGAPHASS